MAGFLKPPDAPNAGAVAGNQLKFGKKAAIFSQRLNQVNQVTPTGSLTYSNIGSKKNPRYQATTALTDPQQALLGAGEKTGLAALQGAGGIIDANAGKWAAGPDVSGQGITDRIMGWGKDFYQPIFDQRRATQEAKLRNQGIAPGSAAWDNAMRETNRGENDAYTQLLLQGQGTALNAANLAYNSPLSAYSTLLSGSGPAGVSLAQTPQANVQTPDYQGAAQANYQAKSQNYQNTLGGLFSIPTTLLGGWARGAI
jgi:hypothetical protein